MEEREANPIGENGGPLRSTRARRLVRVLRLGWIITSSSQCPGRRELASTLGVSRRTIFRDLNLLRAAGIESQHAQQGHAFCTGPIGDLLGRTLTLREVAAILELLDHNHQPKPRSAYDRALRDAKGKIILALRGECSAIPAKLEAVISIFHDE